MSTETTPRPAPADWTWVSTDELAALLGVSTKTITQRWCKREGLPHFRVGDIIRFDLEKVSAWMDSRVRDDQEETATLRSVS